MATRACGECAHFKPGASSEGRPTMVNDPRWAAGECRRYAPKPAAEAEFDDWVWPPTLAEDWCGEFKPMVVPVEEAHPDPIAAAAAELAAFIKQRIALCGHGTIDVTCGACMAAWLPR